MGRLLSSIKVFRKQYIILFFLLMGTLVAFGLHMAAFRMMMIDDRIRQTQDLVQVVHEVIQAQFDRIASEGAEESDVQRQALRQVRALHYGEGEYFWITDKTPTALLNPAMTQVEGKNVSDIKDTRGKALFSDAVKLVEKEGSGIVEYNWPRYGDENSTYLHKISYVAQFKPWGWVIGSGVYIDDINHAFFIELLKVGLVILCVFFLTAALSTWVMRDISEPITRLSRQMMAIAGGDKVVVIDDKRGDEIGDMARALLFFQRAVENLHLQEEQLKTSRAMAIKSRELAEKEAMTVSLLRKATETANTASSVDEAIKNTLELICTFMSWPVGIAFLRDKRSNALKFSGLRFVSDERFYGPLLDVTDKISLAKGEQLAGTAWKNHAPAWINDVATEGGDLQKRVIPPLGLQSMCAFPIIANNEVEYIMEFYSERKWEVSESILSILNEISGQLVTVIDRKRSEEALRISKQLAEQANEAKSSFLANMSHELRTPLNAILGMTRLILKSTKHHEEQHQLADAVFRSSVNLLEIVDDILDLSKIEADEMKLERVGMDIVYTIESVVRSLEGLAAEKNLALSWHQCCSNIPYVLGDPFRLARILTNLIGNAIKYTQKGSIEVYSSYDKPTGDTLLFRCEVIDTGAGIPEDKHRAIFDKFVQADASTTRKYGGTGLGLAITKQLVEMMGGEIGLNSKIGVGSTFWFTIPFTITDHVNRETRTRTRNASGIIPPQKVRVLVAEDNALNTLLITKVLQSFGIGKFEVVETGDGILKRYSEESWDVILMDCHMPGKNGYDTTGEIRAIERGTGRRVPIVAMTANAMVGDKERCLRCGMDEYISKPISFDELKEILGQWIRFDIPQAEETNKIIAEPPKPVLLDMSLIRTFTGGDPAIEKDFANVFLQQGDKNLGLMKKALDSGNVDNWREAAHTFKGGAAGMGANTLAALCNEAQYFNGDPTAQLDLHAKIVTEYDLVKARLKEIGLIS
ncbi:MAG: cache domain-containing protein [Alphaproteobacteria bacterium]|nr:cache domain-containing protein [Alphaproteobacteria bacterium]